MMFDVFTEEIEVLIKDGVSNLYWFRADLYKAWLRSQVPQEIAKKIYNAHGGEGKPLTKRQKMDLLYDELRIGDFDRRLEISRNFVRLLIEQKTFAPQNEMHRIDRAEHCALKLREILRDQQVQRESRESIQMRRKNTREKTYEEQLVIIQTDFMQYSKLTPQKRGYFLEKLFPKLMSISGIPVQESFRIIGEQIDGGIKYDGHYYLIELKWTDDKIGPDEIGNFYYKVDGKLDSRGIIISMGGFTEGVVIGLPRGKEIKVILLDGVHLTSVISGLYTFHELLEHCISHAAYRSELYCPHAIEK